jgi:hypothetical protein
MLIFATCTLDISTRSARNQCLGRRASRRSCGALHCRCQLYHFLIKIYSSNIRGLDRGAYDAYIVLSITECFVQLFGWDLESLCVTTHQKRCQAFLSAGRPDEALEAHRYMMDAIDEFAKASCLDWSNGKFSATSYEATILTHNSLSFQARMQCALCYQRRYCLHCKRL